MTDGPPGPLKCPNCGAPLEFFFLAPGDRAARCPYCGTVVDLPDGPTYYRERVEVWSRGPDGRERWQRRELVRGAGDWQPPPGFEEPPPSIEEEVRSALEAAFGPGGPEGWQPRSSGQRSEEREVLVYRWGGKAAAPGSDGLPPAAQEVQARSGPPAPARSRAVALLLSVFFGFLGADRLYLGYPLLGLLKFLTFGGCGFWWALDVLLLLLGTLRDAQGRPLR